MTTADAPFDFETFFHANYGRTARAIARVIRDPARAEELTVEAFWKLWRHPGPTVKRPPAGSIAQPSGWP